MKANELSAKDLMVGDWVYLSSIMSDDNYPVQVLEIHDDCIKYYCGGKKMMVRFKYIEPIPLTAEIFEKNGFVKQNFDGWEYIHPDDSTFSYIGYRILWRTDYDNHLFIKKYKGSGTSATLQKSDINYVHQFQNALRLCGIEKEIKLCEILAGC